MDNILSIKKELIERVKLRRKEQGLSQTALAARSRVSFGSIKRFERFGEISLNSLLRIALALGCLADFTELFQKNMLLNNPKQLPPPPPQEVLVKNGFPFFRIKKSVKSGTIMNGGFASRILWPSCSVPGARAIICWTCAAATTVWRGFGRG
jgi:transcriptional regulator with XRE-family HTH domain